MHRVGAPCYHLGTGPSDSPRSPQLRPGYFEVAESLDSFNDSPWKPPHGGWTCLHQSLVCRLDHQHQTIRVALRQQPAGRDSGPPCPVASLLQPHSPPLATMGHTPGPSELACPQARKPTSSREPSLISLLPAPRAGGIWVHGCLMNGNPAPSFPGWPAEDGVETCPWLEEGCWDLPCRRVLRLQARGGELGL